MLLFLRRATPPHPHLSRSKSFASNKQEMAQKVDPADNPNNVCWKIFDEYSDKIVDVMLANPYLLEDGRLANRVVSEVLCRNEMEMDKILRLSKTFPVIGCKTLMNSIRRFVWGKTRDPQHALKKIVLILRDSDCFKEIPIEIESRAKELDVILPHEHKPKKDPRKDSKSFEDHKAKEAKQTLSMSELLSNEDSKIDELNSLHNLLDTEGESRISHALTRQEKTIVVDRIKSPYPAEKAGFHALGRCIALSSCTWTCCFTLRGLTKQHIRLFISGLADHPLKGNPTLQHIGFSLNPIGNDGVAHLINWMPESIRGTISHLFLKATSADAKVLSRIVLGHFAKFTQLKHFQFQDNKFEKGEQESLIKVLCKLANLQVVSLSKLNAKECALLLENSPPKLTRINLFEVLSATVERALSSLNKCKTLKQIGIYESEIKKDVVERSLKKSLATCNTLKKLKLFNCAIDSDTAVSIVEAVTTCCTLKKLKLSDNIIVSTTGICRLLQSNSTLSDVYLYHNWFDENSIDEFLALTSCKVTLHLSMLWKKYVETKFPNIEYIKFEEMRNR